MRQIMKHICCWVYLEETLNIIKYPVLYCFIKVWLTFTLIIAIQYGHHIEKILKT